MRGGGVDPSAQAIEAGLRRNSLLDLKQGTADNLPFTDASFDFVMFSFCLCWCDRNDLFKIAYEADRVLKEGGILLIYDFESAFYYKNTYKHYEGVYSHKMNYRDMFLWNPQYSLMEMVSLSHEGDVFHSHPNERVSVSVLYKKPLGAYDTVDPFKK